MFLGSLSGCGFISFTRLSVNDPIKSEDVAFIVPGKTTLAEVVAKLGAPDEFTGLENGAVIVYHFRDGKYSRVNFGWPLQFWSPVSPDLILAGGGFGTDMFQVAFGLDWVARYHAFAKHIQASRYKLWPF